MLPIDKKQLASLSRAIFHWQYSGWVIAVAGGGALTAALSDKFDLAYGFMAICCVFSLGRWLTSDFLKAQRPVDILVLPNGEPYRGSARKYRLWQSGMSLLLLCFFAACVYGVHRTQTTKQLEALEDWLYPSSDPIPSPESECDKMHPLPDESIALYLGNSRLTAGRDVRMWAVILPQDRRIAQPVLVVEQESHSRIAIDLDVRSDDGRIIARIKRNFFVLNPNNMLSKQRPDKSTLLVTDQEGTEVLNVRYLNPHTTHLTGKFYVVGQKEPVVIGEGEQDMGGGRMVLKGACSSPMNDDQSMGIYTSGDGSGNHEYDPPGSKERPLSYIRRWNAAKGEWEHEFRHLNAR